MSDVTRILSAIEQGDASAAEQLLPLVYDELRKLAAQKMAQEKPGQTLQATALVHEAYIRLVDTEKAQHWNSRGHFFGAAAEAMRRILVDSARRKQALLTGRGSYEGRSLPEVVGKIRQAEPVEPRPYQLGIPGSLEQTVLRMLAKRPEDRYQTPSALLRDLAQIGRHEGIRV